jgi:hypothetical protein
MQRFKKSNLSQGFRYLGRYLLQIPSLYRPVGKPHIFIFATRRGGSTLLRDVIYSQPGFNFISQPFNLRLFNPFKNSLPRVKMGQYVSLDDDERAMMKTYLDRLLARKAVFRSQWQIWDRDFHWVWDRYVVKILAAKALIEWFDQAYRGSVRIVYLTRHPIASSLSAITRGFGLTAEAYLEDENLQKKYLTQSQHDLGWKLLQNGSPLEKFVLNWCLENLVPLRLWEEKTWVTVSYESLVSRSQETAERLCEKLGLPDPERMVQRLTKPTRTASTASKSAIISEGAKVRLDAWRRSVNEDDLRKVRQLLDTFQINLYRIDDPYPIPQFEA